MIGPKLMRRLEALQTSYQEVFYYIMRHEFNLGNDIWRGPNRRADRQRMIDQRRQLCDIGVALCVWDELRELLGIETQLGKSVVGEDP